MQFFYTAKNNHQLFKLLNDHFHIFDAIIMQWRMLSKQDFLFQLTKFIIH